MNLTKKLTKSISYIILVLLSMVAVNPALAHFGNQASVPDAEESLFTDEDGEAPLLMPENILAGGAPVPKVILSRADLQSRLSRADVQIVQYGDTTTMVIPTDKFFRFESAKLNEDEYIALYHIADFVKSYEDVRINIAGFTDEAGTADYQKALTEQRAEAVLALLWARGLDIDRLYAEGKGSVNNITSNDTLAGRALNRRIEIQWRV
ncbi:MAG: OmpA family protein [Gammaproteobacteria bacterium]